MYRLGRQHTDNNPTTTRQQPDNNLATSTNFRLIYLSLLFIDLSSMERHLGALVLNRYDPFFFFFLSLSALLSISLDYYCPCDGGYFYGVSLSVGSLIRVFRV